MLIEMKSPAFKAQGKERPPILFKPGLNVILGKEDGAMSIGKSSSLIAIDFVFGGNTYLQSDGVKQEGHHTIYFAFQFDGKKYYFARDTLNSDAIAICDNNYNFTDAFYTRSEFTDWLKRQYKMDFAGLSFRTALSSFFRVYGKKNMDELNPPRGIPGQNMEKSINTIISLYDRFQDIEELSANVTLQKKKLETFRQARQYDFIADLKGGRKQYEENLASIRYLEMQLDTLMEQAEKGHSEKDIALNKKKAALMNEKLVWEKAIHDREMKLRLVSMSVEYGLYPTEADMTALQEFFPDVNIRKLYEVERYHQKLASILDAQFAAEKTSIEKEISVLQEHLDTVNASIKDLGFVGNLSREFLEEHSRIKGEIDALKTQNQTFLKEKDLEAVRANAEAALRKKTEDILTEIEDILNAKMKEFNDSLFTTKKKPPQIHFNSYNSYRFETPDNTGTGSNFKGMLVYDLAVLFTSALPALAHDSLLFRNLGKDVENGIFRIYASTEKQIFIAYDRQGDCRPEAQKILNDNCVLRLSTDHCELYGRSWDNVEEKPEEEQP